MCCVECFVAAIGDTLRTVLGRASGQLSVAADGKITFGSSNSTNSSNSVNVLNNLDWFGPMSFLEFLRDIGKHARVGQMLAKDSVSNMLHFETAMLLQHGRVLPQLPASHLHKGFSVVAGICC